MIEVLFYFGTEIVMVRVNGNHVTFVNSAYGATESTIEGLKLSHEGVIKEFPDLKDSLDWNTEAMIRFKHKIKEMKTEEEVVNYIIEDLRKFGYVPKFKQRQGFRRIVIK